MVDSGGGGGDMPSFHWPKAGPKGVKDELKGPKGLQLEVGARKAPRLLVDNKEDCDGWRGRRREYQYTPHNWHPTFSSSKLTKPMCFRD